MRRFLALVMVAGVGCGQGAGGVEQMGARPPAGSAEGAAEDGEAAGQEGASDVELEGAAGADDAWPADVPRLEGAEVQASSPRVTRLRVEAPEADAAAVLSAWLAQARDDGWQVVAEHGGGASLRRGKSRAYLLVHRSGAQPLRALFGRAVAAPPAVDGPCEPVPEREMTFDVRSSAVDQRGELQRSSRVWRAATSHGHDLDGDGQLDALVPVEPEGSECPWELEHQVWVMRGDCGHRLGTIGPGRIASDVAEAEPDDSGFIPLRVSRKRIEHGKELIPEVTRTTTDFAVSDGAYRAGRAESSTGQCHHCAVSDCRLQP